MRVGITLRVAASHVLLVVVALAVFSSIVVVATDNALTATGTNVDRATALRLAPWIDDLYQQRNSWSAVDQTLQGTAADGPLRTRRAPMMMDNRGTMMRPSDRAAAPFLERDVVVVGRSGEILAATTSAAAPKDINYDRGVPVGSGNSPEAWVFVGSMISDQDNPIRRAIMQSFLRAGTAAALIILLGAITVSVLWARWLLHPIRNIVTASRAMEDGTYSVTVPEPAGNHELRTLARSFNAMAAEVAKQEETRRRFVADAAHELRTPISLLSGRIELLRDGVYETTREQWDALHHSVGRIATLVSDLQTIARLDAGRVTINAHPVDPVQILRDVVEEFRPAAHAKSITLSVELPGATDRPTGPGGINSSSATGLPHSAGAPAEPGAGHAPPRPPDAPVPQPPQPLGSLTADPAKLHQILGNLLSNALRHTPAGGVVTLSAVPAAGPAPAPTRGPGTTREPWSTPPPAPTPTRGPGTTREPWSTPPPAPTPWSKPTHPHPPGLGPGPAPVPDSGVILAVEDSGPGIPPTERERIFERFVRLDADRGRGHGGSGLGLSITQRLVALHGGTIRAVEPTGTAGGARIEVELPR